ncbi:glycosyltransferase [Rhodocyclaceae bacterium]
MKILFLHQNFPSQFAHLAQHLAAQPGNEVMALRAPPNRDFDGVGVFSYRFLNQPQADIHPLLAETEAKVLRGEAVAALCQAIYARGWHPDVIIAHPGWGDALFVRDYWPKARMVIYTEYFYRAFGQDFNCDPEFLIDDLAELQRLRMKNTVMLHALGDADVAYAPNAWQRATFPEWVQERIQVLREGIDSQYFKPDPTAFISFPEKGLTLKAGDEVITYGTRALEPIRGFHVFMRALPEVLRQRKNAHIIILGDERTHYGQSPDGFPTWKARMIHELGDQIDWQRVHFVGYLPIQHYRSILQVSKLHVYLSYPFVLSWSLLEAMACGAHVVASDTAPVREVIADGKNGVLTPLLDSKALAKTMIAQLKLKAEDTAKLRKAARQWVQKHHDPERCMAAMMDLLGLAKIAQAPARTPRKPVSRTSAKTVKTASSKTVKAVPPKKTASSAETIKKPAAKITKTTAKAAAKPAAAPRTRSKK